jgi:hypothetical protein
MTMRLKSWIVVVVTLLGVLSGAAVAVSRSLRPPAREITIVARGMAFYVEGEFVANPTLTVHAGEAIRLTLRNDAPGLQHDFAIPALGVAFGPLTAGQAHAIVFAAPDAQMTVDYLCRPHATMMRGRLQVVAAR